uniref:Protein kinase domain-containing protein n=1 Tax=Bionectria ochroleuca TaxID=29856 RepID=A0A8H7NKY2_BIOOC
MEGAALMTEDVLDPPPRLYERLHQIAGYTWDESKLPFRSTYDFWHVFGTRCVSPISPSTSQSHNISSPGSVSRLSSGNPSPAEHPGYHFDENHFAPQYTPPTQQVSPSQPNFPHITSFFSPTLPSEGSYVEEPVVARISYHGLREERAFHIAKSLTATVDPTGEHIAKPIDLFRLNTAPGDRAAVIVAIYHNLGDNYLPAVLDLGPAYYKAKKEGESYKAFHDPFFKLHQPISLQLFLDFAIGASKCLEILHHGQGIIHGEIRGDAFHFNKEENKVRIASFGSGTRSFENGLTSTGWSSLSKELGAKTKLLYISPEQTGRMPAEPDSRTDIYSLGVLFWMLLTQQQVFDGDTALDIVQGVLGRRIPNVSDIRIDIPDVVGRIIQKCTAKNVTDRYHSASGLRHDLEMVQNYLADGNWAALKELKIASKDVSSFFMLPTIMIGRQRERNQLIKAIDRVSKSHPSTGKDHRLAFLMDRCSRMMLVIWTIFPVRGPVQLMEPLVEAVHSHTQLLRTQQNNASVSSNPFCRTPRLFQQIMVRPLNLAHSLGQLAFGNDSSLFQLKPAVLSIVLEPRVPAPGWLTRLFRVCPDSLVVPNLGGVAIAKLSPWKVWAA